MNYVEQHCTDKKPTAKQGEWNLEPDKVIFKDLQTGYYCLVARNKLGVLCGYVGIPKGHPSWRKDYDDLNYDCHGGLTYCGLQKASDLNPVSNYIGYHKFNDDEDNEIWMVGFDCGHLGDFSPCMPEGLDFGEEQVYRNMAYVKDQVEQLALQIWAESAGDELKKIKIEIGL
jgi:hypothetical protein